MERTQDDQILFGRIVSPANAFGHVANGLGGDHGTIGSVRLPKGMLFGFSQAQEGGQKLKTLSRPEAAQGP